MKRLRVAGSSGMRGVVVVVGVVVWSEWVSSCGWCCCDSRSCVGVSGVACG